MQALKKPTAMYPYGFSRDKFVWSLMSAVGIFFLGAGVSVFNGIQGLIQPREVLDLTIVFYGEQQCSLELCCMTYNANGR